MNQFTAMTWNVENLFRPDGSDPAAVARYPLKLALLARVITGLDVDVVAFQEIGGDDALADLQQKLGGKYPHRAVSIHPDQRGIRVAFLSRLPITEQKHIHEFPAGPALAIQNYKSTKGDVCPVTEMGRGALHIRVEKDGVGINVITAHLKSKLLTFPGGRFSTNDENERAQVAGIALHRRAAEAVTLRTYINGLLKSNDNNPLLLLGDFNDVPEAQTSLILLGPSGSTISVPPSRAFSQKDKGDDVRLFNLAPLIADPALRYSRKHDGRAELLDQILASEELFPRDADGKRRLPAFESHVDFENELAEITDDPNARKNKIAPDHAPVTARFELVATPDSSCADVLVDATVA